MKKKPLTYYRIRDIILCIVGIYIGILFVQVTYESLHKKYILRENGVTVKGGYLYSRKVRKRRRTYNLYFYKFEVDGKEYNTSSRKYSPKGTDSVDIVILPDNPNINAVKQWLDESWLMPPYWP